LRRYRLRSECVVGGIFNPNLHHTQFLTVNATLDAALNAQAGSCVLIFGYYGEELAVFFRL
jgi:hypothetical protein